MKDRRLLPRQCFLVGKLMMNFGFASMLVATTSMSPGRNSPRLQAAS